MAFRVIHDFADGSSEDICDEVFATYEEAEEAAAQASSDYSQGGDVLELAGETPGAEITGWRIIEE